MSALDRIVADRWELLDLLNVVGLLVLLEPLHLAGVNPEVLDDPDERARDMRGIGHWGVGDVEVRVASHADIEPVMDLVSQTFQAGEDSGSDEELYPVDAVERIIERALTFDDQQALRRLVEVGVVGGLYPRPWTRAIMFAPPQKRSVALLTVRIGRDGQIETVCAVENWQPYVDVSAERARAALGTEDWAVADGARGVNRLSDSLEELLADAAFPGRSKRAHWNGHDFYVILGTFAWEDCRRHGFVAASGGPVYTRPLDQLFLGARVFAYYSPPTRGYVGIGTVTETSTDPRVPGAGRRPTDPDPGSASRQSRGAGARRPRRSRALQPTRSRAVGPHRACGGRGVGNRLVRQPDGRVSASG